MQCFTVRWVGCWTTAIVVSAKPVKFLGPRRGLAGWYYRSCVNVNWNPTERIRFSGSWRSYSDHRVAVAPFTTVEPGKDEQFVFQEYADPEKEGDPVEVERLLQESLQQFESKDAEQSTGIANLIERLPVSFQQDVSVTQPAADKCRQSKRTSRVKEKKRQPGIYGNPAPDVLASDICCSGCGAVMHCRDPGMAGYLPSETYLALQEEGALHQAVCQRCYLLVHYRRALDITVSKEEYCTIVGSIRSCPSGSVLVLLMVDLLDLPCSIVPDLLSLVGEQKRIIVLGNKIDLLPGDSKNYLKRIRQQVLDCCVAANIKSENIEDVHLISAKTGYGVERLISSLQSSWKYKGDVYLVGATNTGKSTLFNTFLESDYCKSKASDIIRRATISPWPGTTLNLLKFPIINPTPYRMFRRLERLKADAVQMEEQLSEEEQRHLNHLRKQGYLIGRIGRTFHSTPSKSKGEEMFEFDPDALSLSSEEEKPECSHLHTSLEVAFTPNELKFAHWFYDTPGIMKDYCVLNHLNEKELKIVVPSRAIIPRTFILKPGMVLFLGALGRIDFLKGENSAWFSVIASNLLPVHITTLEKADDIYQRHAGKTLLQVPIGGEERMMTFPPLVPQEVTLKGIGPLEAVADIKLSSLGWVAVTAQMNDHLELQAYVPAGKGLMVRQPPLLPHIVNIKGERIRKSPAYKTKKPEPLVENLKHKS